MPLAAGVAGELAISVCPFHWSTASGKGVETISLDAWSCTENCYSEVSVSDLLVKKTENLADPKTTVKKDCVSCINYRNDDSTVVLTRHLEDGEPKHWHQPLVADLGEMDGGD